MNPADILWGLYTRLYTRLTDALIELDDNLADPTEPLITQHRQETP